MGRPAFVYRFDGHSGLPSKLIIQTYFPSTKPSNNQRLNSQPHSQFLPFDFQIDPETHMYKYVFSVPISGSVSFYENFKDAADDHSLYSNKMIELYEVMYSMFVIALVCFIIVAVLYLWAALVECSWKIFSGKFLKYEIVAVSVLGFFFYGKSFPNFSRMEYQLIL